MPDAIVESPREPEPTLATMLHGVALAQMPARFYQGLQLAIPAAVHLWSIGARRTALWFAVVSAFGIWSLCQQAIARRESWKSEIGRESRMRRFATGATRLLAGTAAAVTAGGLLAEAFTRLMAIVFKCPGCAG